MYESIDTPASGSYAHPEHVDAMRIIFRQKLPTTYNIDAWCYSWEHSREDVEVRAGLLLGSHKQDMDVPVYLKILRETDNAACINPPFVHLLIRRSAWEFFIGGLHAHQSQTQKLECTSFVDLIGHRYSFTYCDKHRHLSLDNGFRISISWKTQIACSRTGSLQPSCKTFPKNVPLRLYLNINWLPIVRTLH